MKKGLLIFNRSFVSLEVVSHLDMFVHAFRKCGCELTMIENLTHWLNNHGKIVVEGVEDINQYSFALFYDKDILLAQSLEACGLKLFNSSEAINNCDDKYLTFQLLSGMGINMPTTISSYLCYRGKEDIDRNFINFVESKISYPLIVKENSGSQGKQVYLVENSEQLLKIRRELLHTKHLYQQFIIDSKGIDHRYYVVAGKVVGASKRVNTHDFRSNVAGGGKMTVIPVDTVAQQIALSATKKLNLHFATVDFLVSGDQYFLCEINSNPFFYTYLQISGINLAEEIANSICGEL